MKNFKTTTIPPLAHLICDRGDPKEGNVSSVHLMITHWVHHGKEEAINNLDFV